MPIRPRLSGTWYGTLVKPASSMQFTCTERPLSYTSQCRTKPRRNPRKPPSNFTCTSSVAILPPKAAKFAPPLLPGLHGLSIMSRTSFRLLSIDTPAACRRRMTVHRPRRQDQHSSRQPLSKTTGSRWAWRIHNLTESTLFRPGGVAMNGPAD